MTDAISKERLAELIAECCREKECCGAEIYHALRELQQLHDERKRLLDFFTTYALGPKKRPSCLVCGTVPEQWPPAIEHAELPGIIVCHPCRDARSELQQLREQVRVQHGKLVNLRESLRIDRENGYPPCQDDINELDELLAAAQDESRCDTCEGSGWTWLDGQKVECSGCEGTGAQDESHE